MSRVTVLVFLILTRSNVGCLCVGWIYSLDVRAWWPVALVVLSIVAPRYAVVFSAATRAARGLGIRFATVYSAALALTLLVQATLVYVVEIDWLAVNSGLVHLTPFRSHS